MTTAALPSGFVSNTDIVSSELNDFDAVDVEIISKLWRVYTTNKSTLERDAGRRLENLLWRIWSSSRLCLRIRGSTLAWLFLHISEDSPIDPNWNGKTPQDVTNGSVRQHQQQEEDNSAKKPSLPPPILKKPQTTSTNQPKNERVLFLDGTGPDSSLGTETQASQSQAAHGSSPRAVRSSLRTSPPRKRTTFATDLASLGEDSATRTQRNAGQADAQKGIQPDLPTNARDKTVEEREESCPFQQPYQFDRNQQQEKPSTNSAPRSPKNDTKTTTPKQQHVADKPALVDKNFRSKFVEKQQQRISAACSLEDLRAIDGHGGNSGSGIFLPPTSASPIPVIQRPHHLQVSTSSDRIDGQSATSLSSTSLSRSPSVQMGSSNRPAQSQLSKLLESEHEKSPAEKSGA